MENINYSLVEYFEKKYPKQKYKVKGSCYDGGIGEETTDWEFYGPSVCHTITEVGKLGYKEYNKLITDLRKLFTPYNLKIYSEDGDDVYNPLGEKNKVSFSTEFKEHVFHDELIGYLPCELGIEHGSIFTETVFSNITPEIFLEDIKKILEKYCILGWNGNDKQELNSVASVFMKYMELKTPPHITKLRQSHQNTIEIFRERENKLNWELKQYTDLKELQDMKDLVEKNKILMEENIKLVEKEDVRQKVQQWLENNSSEINFKIGKELYDIIN